MKNIIKIILCLFIFTNAYSADELDFKSCKFNSYKKWYSKIKNKDCYHLSKIKNSNLRARKEKYIKDKFKHSNYSKYMSHKNCIAETFSNISKNSDMKCKVLIDTSIKNAVSNKSCKVELMKEQCKKYETILKDINESTELSRKDVDSGHKTFPAHLDYKACNDLKIHTYENLHKKVCKNIKKKNKLPLNVTLPAIFKKFSIMCPPGRHLQGINQGTPVCN